MVSRRRTTIHSHIITRWLHSNSIPMKNPVPSTAQREREGGREGGQAGGREGGRAGGREGKRDHCWFITGCMESLTDCLYGVGVFSDHPKRSLEVMMYFVDILV